MVVHWPAMGAGGAELALTTVVAVGCGVLGCKRRRSACDERRGGGMGWCWSWSLVELIDGRSEFGGGVGR